MAATPTPGPWKWDGYKFTGLNDESVLELDDDGACGDPECCGAPSYYLAVKDADAALIVAACNACQQLNPANPLAVAEALPDALSAMRLALADLESDELCDCCGEPTCPDYSPCWKCSIRAALAKLEAR